MADFLDAQVYRQKQALVQSAPVTKDGLGHGKLVNQVKETRVARSSGGHPCLLTFLS
jgi:hypothetical protein